MARLQHADPAAARSGVSPPPRSSAVERFAPPPPQVSAHRILRLQGYTGNRPIRAAIRDAAQWAARTAETHAAPAACYRRLAVCDCAGERLALADGTILRCGAFAQYLATASHVALFVLTVGQAIDARVVELADRGELLEALLLEAAGWLALEDVTRRFKHHLAQEVAQQGRRIGMRMGPGYSYRTAQGEQVWPLEEQGALFGAFGDAVLPVELMSSSAMRPKLSRSGLYCERRAEASRA